MIFVWLPRETTDLKGFFKNELAIVYYTRTSPDYFAVYIFHLSCIVFILQFVENVLITLIYTN